MKESKHTPGPWKVEGNTVYALYDNESAPTFREVGTNRMSLYVQPYGNPAETKADVRLIANAPRMYGALAAAREAYWETVDGDAGTMSTSEWVTMVMDTLAVIEGRREA